MTARRHIIAALLRATLAVPVALALPAAHVLWGERYPGGGANAMGFLAVFILIGVGAGISFFAVGSLAQFLLRRRMPRHVALVDLVMSAAFVAFLMWAGVTARYN